jgi:hypothetical protein
MMARIYMVFGIAICALFLFDTYRGAQIFDGGTTGSKPTGGAAHYHK